MQRRKKENNHLHISQVSVFIKLMSKLRLYNYVTHRTLKETQNSRYCSYNYGMTTHI